MTIIPSRMTVTVVPSLLPPTGGAAVVTVLGQVVSSRDSVKDGFFQVTDEYRQFEPRGPVALTPLGPSDGYYRYGFAFNIKLPHEQTLNPYATESYEFLHFAPRKIVMTLYADAYIYFPGGFGTLDELSEILTLIQTGKTNKAPIITPKYGEMHNGSSSLPHHGHVLAW